MTQNADEPWADKLWHHHEARSWVGLLSGSEFSSSECERDLSPQRVKIRLLELIDE